MKMSFLLVNFRRDYMFYNNGKIEAIPNNWGMFDRRLKLAYQKNRKKIERHHLLSQP
jgi:hypothetical protein